MPLEEIPLTLDLESALPPKVAALIEEAGRRADQFYEAGLGLRYPNYVPSDPNVVHAAIACLIREDRLRGSVFCEWGCGFAIASGIAALLGMTAFGIEIEPDIASRAEGLMSDLSLPVEILVTNFLPEGFDECEGVGGKDLISPKAWIVPGGFVSPPQYDGLDPDEVDLFFVYPWPGQEQMVMDLFEAVASDGAVLLIYLGEGEIEAWSLD